MSYQTIRTKKEVIPGDFPTLDWFEKIKEYVPFKGSRVLDVGCNTGMMSVCAMQEGAFRVVGIDQDADYIKQAKDLASSWGYIITFFQKNITTYDYPFTFNIGLFSMVIHWIGEEETKRALSCVTDHAVIIHRLPNKDYLRKNGIWFPTPEELDAACEGFVKKHSEILMEQDKGKQIMLSIYER